MSKKVFWIGLIIFLLLIIVPYLLAYLMQGSEFHFGGFLLNPLDGNSYLAKMEEGKLGSWTFNLLYSPHSSAGSYLFLFYLFLGHLGKWFSLPLILIFHLARIAAAIFLLFELRKLINWIFEKNPSLAGTAFIWTVFGGGLGWLLLAFGLRTSDFWVAEAYPFLSSYVNPHFPLALGLILLAFRLAETEFHWKKLIFLALIGLGLSIIQPFAVVIVGLILFSATLWKWIVDKKLQPWQVAVFALGGAPFLIYQFVITRIDPELMIWNQQNLTPAPPIWDFLVSFLPAIVFAIIGIVLLFKNKTIYKYKVLVIWLFVGIILTYFPFSLQRRFMLGFYIPVVALAVIGITLLFKKPSHEDRIARLSAVLSFVTPAMIILIGIFGAASQFSILYTNNNEDKALAWLKSNSTAGEVALAQPTLSMYIPGSTGLRVVYGHPFETVNASSQQAGVDDFYNGKMTDIQESNFLQLNSVRFILQENSATPSTSTLENLGFLQVAQFGNLIIFENKQ